MTKEQAEGWSERLTDHDNRPAGTQSIRRAILVLRVLTTSGQAGLGLTEIARATGLTRPTAHRVLKVLLSEGVAEQRLRTRRYGTALHVQLVAAPQAASSPLLSAAVPYLREAADQIGDTLFLTLRSGFETICVARRLGSYPVQVLALDVGSSRPLGVSSAGIAILASLPPAEARRVLVQNARQLQHYRMTLDDSLAAVAQARRLGYALRERGLIAGTRAVSVTFAQRDAGALVALTVAAVSRRLQPGRVNTIVEQLRLHAARIEHSLADVSTPDD